MIVGISVALIVAGLLLVLLKRTGIPEIPIYLVSGIILGIVERQAESAGIIAHPLVEAEIMRELALLGLGILVFYRTSGMVVDPERETSLKSFKASFWLSLVTLLGISGASVMAGLSLVESVLFGFTASIGSTLMTSGLVKEEARKNHVYGWLAEDMNFYDDIFGIFAITILFTFVSGQSHFIGLLVALGMVFAALILREKFSDLMLEVTGRENELILLLGISTVVGSVWIAESVGITAIAGLYASGLLIADTELGFRIRERFSSVKDFFTALSFFAVGFLVVLPSADYLIMAAVILGFVSVFRPLIGSQTLKLEGYDIRTGFMARTQIAQVSELAVLAALLLLPVIGNEAFHSLTLAFAASTLVSHYIQGREHEIFERLFSNYELEPELSSLPEDLSQHIILAGYDWKTRGLEELTDRQVVAVDYDMVNVREAKERDLPHLLADLYSHQSWEMLEYRDASIIVSATEDRTLQEKIRELDTDAELILAKGDSDRVREELRSIFSSAIKEKEEK